MSLPKIDHPTFDVNLSIGTIKYRPFLVREQKILLMAHDSDDVDSTYRAIKQVVSNCILTPDVDVDGMPLSDLSILFLHLRARSMGEQMKAYFRCKNMVEGKECGMLVDTSVDLLKVGLDGGGANPKIMLAEKMGVTMHYPSFDLLNYLTKAKSIDAEFTLVAGCISNVFDDKGVYPASEAKPEELIAFLDQLPDDKYQKLKDFIETAPVVKHVSHEKCTKCGFEHELVLEGLSDFFV